MKKILLPFTLFLSQLIFAQTPSFPGAEGFGAHTTGGRGGQVIYVTNLNDNGPGSLAEALATPGPRYILFKVSGVINSNVETVYGDYTLAGQTSPSGIIVRGFVVDEVYDTIGTGDNIIIRHLRSRSHDPAQVPGNPQDDAFRLDGASNVIVDHCSFANAIDESVQLSQSSKVTFQNCMLSETLGDHFYLGGMLINYSTADHPQDSISLHHNTWNRMGGRLPELTCESSYCGQNPLNLELSNNLIWDQQINVWYNSNIDQTATFPVDSFFINLNYVNNYSVGRTSYTSGMAAHNLLQIADNNIFASGNKMNLYPSYSDYQLFYCCNDFDQPGSNPNTDLGVAAKLTARHNFPPITYTTTDSVVSYMYKNVGAFPRDSMDRRLTKPFPSGIPNSAPVDSADHFHDAFILPTFTPNFPTDTDNDGMPDYWETAHGLNPNTADHNATNLSLAITGTAGYTNLECYLNCLSDCLVAGLSTAQCGVVLNVPETAVPQNSIALFQNSPNPFMDETTISFMLQQNETVVLKVTDLLGRDVCTLVDKKLPAGNYSFPFNIKNLNAGVYFYSLQTPTQTLIKKMVLETK
ncbi:MAG: T9SS type A sorting domain-containing protein [Bacteroidota bacterium]